MQCFRFERDRLAFLVSHGLARMALSSCAQSVSPEAWEFGSGQRGKPEIVAPKLTPTLRFNISHTHGLVVCLVAVQIDCGVDVEVRSRDINVTQLASSVLSPAEYATLQSTAPDERHRLFFRYWTLKEAYIKARGYGMSIALDKFGFEFCLKGICARFESSLNEDDREWQFEQWSPTGTHLLALALHRGQAAKHRVVCHDRAPAI
jgi:4'-phosphopantetheinyl transferase